MAFLEKLVGKREEDVDLEEFLNNMDVQEDNAYENADALVKPVTLTSEQDVAFVIDEAKKGNIVLLNIADLSKRNVVKLREYVDQIKSTVLSIDGDMARLSQDRVMITPARVKIVKRKGE
ncbi:MAG: cell division protein SepF [Candidatus Diapherotrites archaeon]|nr:cell division protein SepF [Candidatus Diapherotrites archaeon]